MEELSETLLKSELVTELLSLPGLAFSSSVFLDTKSNTLDKSKLKDKVEAPDDELTSTSTLSEIEMKPKGKEQRVLFDKISNLVPNMVNEPSRHCDPKVLQKVIWDTSAATRMVSSETNRSYRALLRELLAQQVGSGGESRMVEVHSGALESSKDSRISEDSEFDKEQGFNSSSRECLVRTQVLSNTGDVEHEDSDPQLEEERHIKGWVSRDGGDLHRLMQKLGRPWQGEGREDSGHCLCCPLHPNNSSSMLYRDYLYLLRTYGFYVGRFDSPPSCLSSMPPSQTAWEKNTLRTAEKRDKVLQTAGTKETILHAEGEKKSKPWTAGERENALHMAGDKENTLQTAGKRAKKSSSGSLKQGSDGPPCTQGSAEMKGSGHSGNSWRRSLRNLFRHKKHTATARDPQPTQLYPEGRQDWASSSHSDTKLQDLAVSDSSQDSSLLQDLDMTQQRKFSDSYISPEFKRAAENFIICHQQKPSSKSFESGKGPSSGFMILQERSGTTSEESSDSISHAELEKQHQLTGDFQISKEHGNKPDNHILMSGSFIAKLSSYFSKVTHSRSKTSHIKRLASENDKQPPRDQKQKQPSALDKDTSGTKTQTVCSLSPESSVSTQKKAKLETSTSHGQFEVPERASEQLNTGPSERSQSGSGGIVSTALEAQGSSTSSKLLPGLTSKLTTSRSPSPKFFSSSRIPSPKFKQNSRTLSTSLASTPQKLLPTSRTQSLNFTPTSRTVSSDLEQTAPAAKHIQTLKTPSANLAQPSRTPSADHAPTTESLSSNLATASANLAQISRTPSANLAPTTETLSSNLATASKSQSLTFTQTSKPPSPNLSAASNCPSPYLFPASKTPSPKLSRHTESSSTLKSFDIEPKAHSETQHLAELVSLLLEALETTKHPDLTPIENAFCGGSKQQKQDAPTKETAELRLVSSTATSRIPVPLAGCSVQSGSPTPQPHTVRAHHATFPVSLPPPCSTTQRPAMASSTPHNSSHTISPASDHPLQQQVTASSIPTEESHASSQMPGDCVPHSYSSYLVFRSGTANTCSSSQNAALPSLQSPRPRGRTGSSVDRHLQRLRSVSPVGLGQPWRSSHFHKSLNNVPLCKHSVSKSRSGSNSPRQSGMSLKLVQSDEYGTDSVPFASSPEPRGGQVSSQILRAWTIPFFDENLAMNDADPERQRSAPSPKASTEKCAVPSNSHKSKGKLMVVSSNKFTSTRPKNRSLISVPYKRSKSTKGEANSTNAAEISGRQTRFSSSQEQGRKSNPSSPKGQQSGSRPSSPSRQRIKYSNCSSKKQKGEFRPGSPVRQGRDYRPIRSKGMKEESMPSSSKQHEVMPSSQTDLEWQHDVNTSNPKVRHRSRSRCTSSRARKIKKRSPSPEPTCGDGRHSRRCHSKLARTVFKQREGRRKQRKADSLPNTSTSCSPESSGPAKDYSFVMGPVRHDQLLFDCFK